MSNEKNHEILEGEDEAQIIELIDNEGKQVRYELLDVVPYEEEEYIVVVPEEGSGEEADEVEIYRIVPDEEEDTETYVGLSTLEEVEAVYAAFKERNQEWFNFES